jgi:hypothetical protein
MSLHADTAHHRIKRLAPQVLIDDGWQVVATRDEILGLNSTFGCETDVDVGE